MQQVSADSLRIVGGDRAMLSQYPFISGLVNKGDDATQVFCGASVVNENWILTAAHCVEGERAARLDVLLNTDNLQSTGNAERIAVSQIVMHPQYNSQTTDNDIALLKLSQPTTVTPISVATAANAALEQTDRNVSVAGWGNRSASGTDYPSQLHAVNLTVSDFNRCDRAYDNSLNKGHICAGTPQGGKDSCQGDSGGPLIARTTEGPVQLGVVSFGQDCGDRDFPGVYTRVSHYGDFLERANVNVTGPTQPTDPVDPVDPVDTVDPVDPIKPATPAYLNRVRLKRIDSFRRVEVGDTGYALLEVFNPTNRQITVSNITVDVRPGTAENGMLTMDYEDCTFAPLQRRESCFIDIAWTPEAQGRLRSLITVDVSHDGHTKTLKKGAGGNAKSMSDFGDAIEFPWAQFDSNHANPWQRSHENPVNGDSSIETEISTEEAFFLSGDFSNAQASTLSFQYSLTGATAIIEVNGEPLYELAATDDDWSDAELQIPANALVTWTFRPDTASASTGKVRLDDFRMLATDTAKESTSESDSPSADATAGGSAGGSFTLLPLLILGLFAGVRRRRQTGANLARGE